MRKSERHGDTLIFDFSVSAFQRLRRLDGALVAPVAFSFQRLLVLISAENVFVELHVGAAEGFEKVSHLLGVVHSYRSATIGSIRMARRDGGYAASSATIKNNVETPANDTPSTELSP